MSKTIDLVHGMEIGLGKLIMFNIGKVFAEPRKKRNQFVIGKKIELDC